MTTRLNRYVAQGQVVLFLNELFRGTHTHRGIDISGRILTLSINHVNNCYFPSKTIELDPQHAHFNREPLKKPSFETTMNPSFQGAAGKWHALTAQG